MDTTPSTKNKLTEIAENQKISNAFSSLNNLFCNHKIIRHFPLNENLYIIPSHITNTET